MRNLSYKYTYVNPLGLSKLLTNLLIIGALLNLVAALSSYFQYDLILSIKEGVSFTDEAVNANDDRQAVIGILQTIIFISTAILFGKWVYRISWNAHYFSISSQRHSPGWAVAYYFIPIVSLWRPYQALRDAYNTFVDATVDEIDKVKFPLWWFFWLLSIFIGNIVLRLSFRAEEIDEILLLSFVTMLSDSLDIILNVIAIGLVAMVTKACLSHKERQKGAQFADTPATNLPSMDDLSS